MCICSWHPVPLRKIPCLSEHLLFLPVQQPGLASGNNSNLTWGAAPYPAPRPEAPGARRLSPERAGDPGLGFQRLRGGSEEGSDPGWDLGQPCRADSHLAPTGKWLPEDTAIPGASGERGTGAGEGTGQAWGEQAGEIIPAPGPAVSGTAGSRCVSQKNIPFCAFASLSWVPSFVTKRVLRNVWDKLWGEAGVRGDGSGESRFQSAEHPPPRLRMEGHRAEGTQLAAKVRIGHGPGGSWEGPPKLMAGPICKAALSPHPSMRPSPLNRGTCWASRPVRGVHSRCGIRGDLGILGGH